MTPPNQMIHRTAAPRFGFGCAGLLGRWIRSRRSSPAAVGDLGRSAAFSTTFMKPSESTITSTRLERLRVLRAKSFVPYLLPFLLIVLFGFSISSHGQVYALVFFAALTVTISLHSISERRSRREIDLVMALLAEERKVNRND